MPRNAAVLSSLSEEAWLRSMELARLEEGRKENRLEGRLDDGERDVARKADNGMLLLPLRLPAGDAPREAGRVSKPIGRRDAAR